MSRYVCDFSQVTNAGVQLCNAAGKLRTAANKYNSGIDMDLAQWTGEAKKAFASSNAEQIEYMRLQADYLESLGEFIKDASKKIESLDSELSGLEI